MLLMNLYQTSFIMCVHCGKSKDMHNWFNKVGTDGNACLVVLSGSQAADYGNAIT